MAKIKRVLKQVGDKIVVKNIVEDEELNPKGVLDQLNALQGVIDRRKSEILKVKQEISQTEENIVKSEESIELYQDDLKELNKYSDWAKKYQISKFNNIFDEIKDECFNKVCEEYKFDKAMTDEQNDMAKFRAFQHKVATHPRMSEDINQNIINEQVFTDCEINNPWK